MIERPPSPSVLKFAREEPDPSDPRFVAKLQHAANLANENCDRAMTLAHKLSTQLREAQDRINQLERDAEGFADQLRADADAALASFKYEADARVKRTMREADERVEHLRAETENRMNHMRGELAQAKMRAERAERWLVQIRREIESQLMPVLATMHDRLRPGNA
jgi:chromosome segregation ATPase